MRRTAALLAIFVLAASIPVGAQDRTVAETVYSDVNHALVESHIRPRYAKFAAAGAAFDTRTRAFCAASPPRDLKPVRAAFLDALSAWMGVAHIPEGPAELFMRQARLLFWPDKRGRTGKQLRAFVAADDGRLLVPERFPTMSVALQGFGAAERLLFEHVHFEQLTMARDGIRCALLHAIAHNVARTGAELVREWDDEAFAREFRRAGRSDSRFGSHRDATAMLVNGLFTSLKVISDYKLDRVIGRTLEDARPKRAELWRSERSLGNIVDNLSALQALYEGERGSLGLRALLEVHFVELANLVSRAFTKTLETARQIPVPLSLAVADETGRPAILLLARQTRALKSLIAKELAPALGTPIGFNALDGD